LIAIDSQSVSFIEHKGETRQCTDFNATLQRTLGIFILSLFVNNNNNNACYTILFRYPWV